MDDPHITLRVEIDGIQIAAVARRPTSAGSGPLIVALHGGGYTGRYFDVAGASLLHDGAAHGFTVATVDRPNYGASGAVELGDDTYERQAELLDRAVARVAEELSATGVVLVGHSIGGMIVLLMAARRPSYPLWGVSTVGMGAVMPTQGAAEGLAAAAVAAGTPRLDLPAEQVDTHMFGPDWTFEPAVRDAAHAAYAPVPVVELVVAPRWPQVLPVIAPRVTVPVQNVLGEFDSLWDTSPESLAAFSAAFSAARFVDVQLIRGSGHSTEHHRVGRALRLRQLAFAEECVVLATAP